MKLFQRKKAPDNSIRGNVLKKLRKVSDQQIIMWVDNIHTGLGKNVQELRKSLGTSDQALIYTEDIRTGAVSLLAAMQVLEERRQLEN